MGYDIDNLSAATPMPKAKVAERMVLLFCPPGKTPEPVGILLLDSSDRLFVKLKTKLDHDDQATLAVWEGLAEDLHQEAAGYQVVRWLEMNGSHVFQLSPRQVVETEDLTQALDDLYHENVE